ncbi:MAG: tRNA (cytidine(34)-2'-O)-methyltransferase [Clostridia bacterium]
MHPLGFRIDEKSLKRAGLDYWDKLEIEEHKSLNEFLTKYPPEENNMFFATTKGKTKYTDIDYSKMEEVFVLYGKETKGLPEDLLEKYLDQKTIRIPMLPTLRSLNLSNSVAIITYEILRQHNFEDLQEISNYFDVTR